MEKKSKERKQSKNWLMKSLGEEEMDTYDLNVAIKFPIFWKMNYLFDKREKVNVVMTYEELAKIVDLLKKVETDER